MTCQENGSHVHYTIESKSCGSCRIASCSVAGWQDLLRLWKLSEGDNNCDPCFPQQCFFFFNIIALIEIVFKSKQQNHTAKFINPNCSDVSEGGLALMVTLRGFLLRATSQNHINGNSRQLPEGSLNSDGKKLSDVLDLHRTTRINSG